MFIDFIFRLKHFKLRKGKRSCFQTFYVRCFLFIFLFQISKPPTLYREEVDNRSFQSQSLPILGKAHSIMNKFSDNLKDDSDRGLLKLSSV